MRKGTSKYIVVKYMSSKNKYPVLCAWCSARGIKTIMHYSSVKDSHGICENCKKILALACKKYYGGEL